MQLTLIPYLKGLMYSPLTLKICSTSSCKLGSLMKISCPGSSCSTGKPSRRGGQLPVKTRLLSVARKPSRQRLKSNNAIKRRRLSILKCSHHKVLAVRREMSLVALLQLNSSCRTRWTNIKMPLTSRKIIHSNLLLVSLTKMLLKGWGSWNANRVQQQSRRWTVSCPRQRI